MVPGECLPRSARTPRMHKQSALRRIAARGVGRDRVYSCLAGRPGADNGGRGHGRVRYSGRIQAGGLEVTWSDEPKGAAEPPSEAPAQVLAGGAWGPRAEVGELVHAARSAVGIEPVRAGGALRLLGARIVLQHGVPSEGDAGRLFGGPGCSLSASGLRCRLVLAPLFATASKGAHGRGGSVRAGGRGHLARRRARRRLCRHLGRWRLVSGPPGNFSCSFVASGSRRRLALDRASSAPARSDIGLGRVDGAGGSREHAPAHRSPRACLSARLPGTRPPGPRLKSPGVRQRPCAWFRSPIWPFVVVVVGGRPACPSLSPERLWGSALRQDRDMARRRACRIDHRRSGFSRSARVPPGRRELWRCHHRAAEARARRQGCRPPRPRWPPPCCPFPPQAPRRPRSRGERRGA